MNNQGNQGLQLQQQVGGGVIAQIPANLGQTGPAQGNPAATATMGNVIDHEHESGEFSYQLMSDRTVYESIFLRYCIEIAIEEAYIAKFSSAFNWPN
ncbi:hypothetical protein FRC17_001643 [Serendipita sp. 399]|nr:hypothetical protein FRC17_001643 [Serendipita sp. 399]